MTNYEREVHIENLRQLARDLELKADEVDLDELGDEFTILNVDNGNLMLLVKNTDLELTKKELRNAKKEMNKFDYDMAIYRLSGTVAICNCEFLNLDEQ